MFGYGILRRRADFNGCYISHLCQGVLLWRGGFKWQCRCQDQDRVAQIQCLSGNLLPPRSRHNLQASLRPRLRPALVQRQAGVQAAKGSVDVEEAAAVATVTFPG